MQDFRDRMFLDKKTNLWTLILINEEIESLTGLENLKNLQKLNLFGTQITSLTGLENLENLQELNLGETQITSLTGLENLENLQELYLDGTQITSLTGLENLVNLQKLNLDGTQITSLTGLENLKNLQELYLFRTQITSLTGLENLKNLQVLNLFGTQITSLTGLENFENLQELNLGGTQITSLTGLENLENLQELNLFGTQITSLTGLENFENLQELNLGGTQITSLTGLENLVNLQKLNLDETQITSLTGLENLKNLQRLDLSGTQITSLDGIEELTYLKTLDISHLKIHSIPKALVELGLEFVFSEDFWLYNSGINLYNTTIATQPISLFEQPREFIEAYYDAEQVAVKESKVIFLGDGGAGKSYTIARIKDNDLPDNYDTEATPGVDITDYHPEGENNDITINFWDFGGQEIMHAMHRCFLTTRTCYVVVICNRWDLTRQARYWLKSIDSFAKGAPVIIAINKWKGVNDIPIDTTRLYDEFKNVEIVDIVPYSAKRAENDGFDQLVSKIVAQAKKMDSCSMYLPEQWANIRKEVLESAKKNPYISMEDYYGICDKNGLGEEYQQIRTWLLDWFNDLGICFSYHKDRDDMTKLAEYKVLDPKWLTNAVYKLVNCNKKMFVKNGNINNYLLSAILNTTKECVIPDITYEDYECDYILEVMRKFNLSYSVDDQDEFVPALCENETPKNLHPISMSSHYSYEMRYSYLPDAVVHQLMIKCYSLLDNGIVWRKGMRIKDYSTGAIAVVDAGGDNSVLRIDIYEANDTPTGFFLHQLREDIKKINAKLGLEAKDYILVHENGESVEFRVDMLIAAKDAKDSQVPQYNEKLGYKHYSVDKLLGMTFGVENVKRANEIAPSFAEGNSSGFAKAIYNIGSIIINNNHQTIGEDIINRLLDDKIAVNEKLLDLLADNLKNNDDSDIKHLGDKMQKEKRKSIPERIKGFRDGFNDWFKTGENVVKLTKAIGAIMGIAELLQNIPK